MKKYSTRPGKIPGTVDWAGYEVDLDVRHAHKIFFGKKLGEVLDYFGGIQSIRRADELLNMPRRAFQYYVFAFAEFVTSDAARCDSESASPFLRLLRAREKKDPGSVAQIYAALLPYIEYVAAHQEVYEADFDIYGSFVELAAEIATTCEASLARD